MIITIDGRAATKKSPVAFLLSNKLGFKHINSGLVYRAVAIEVMKEREQGLTQSGSFMEKTVSKLRFNDYKIAWLGSGIEKVENGDVTHYSEDELMSPSITACSSDISVNARLRAAIRDFLVREAKKTDTVIDGRDMGRKVFPEADIKFFFEATFDSRVAWRHKYEGIEYKEPVEAVELSLKNRDADSFWIKPANDAIIIDVEELDVHNIADNLLHKYVVPYNLKQLRPTL